MDTIQKAELVDGVVKITSINIQDLSETVARRDFLTSNITRMQTELITLNKLILDAGTL